MIQQKFKELSNNKDSLSRDKVIELVQLIGQDPTVKQLNDGFEACEFSDKAELSLDECYAVIMSILYEIEVDNDKDSELREAFKTFDADNDGFLAANEFKTAMSSWGVQLTEDELSEMMSTICQKHVDKMDFEGNKTFFQLSTYLFEKLFQNSLLQ